MVRDRGVAWDNEADGACATCIVRMGLRAEAGGYRVRKLGGEEAEELERWGGVL